MKQVHISRGRALVLDVPAPTAGPGELLVQVRSSCLSVGTEMAGVRGSAAPLWKRALQRPDQVVTTLQSAVSKGVGTVWREVKQKTDAAKPTGYSAAGVVVGVGADIDDVALGSRVACAGGGYAQHAEFVRVPRNLCAHMPDGLSWEAASTVTLGAIALQGVRRASPTLGETFVVIGLGILGQLTSQLLRANGCRVIGVDLDKDRVQLAERLGMNVGLPESVDDEAAQVARITDGLGADGVIVTAAGSTDSIMSTAFRVCRKKGRVVLVGDVGLNLNREDFYAKEIDFFISTSYGPGRYDGKYEEEGLDYPAAYVRWTENRNMAEYLHLLGEGRVDVEPLVTAQYDVAEADQAYRSLEQTATPRPMMVLLTYPGQAEAERTLRVRRIEGTTTERIRVAVVGAGSFARSTHLPNLGRLADKFSLRTVVARSGASAAAAARDFGAEFASSDYAEVLDDAEIDAVIIATRHDLHAKMTLAALQAGKHVLVEKPLALFASEVDALEECVSSSRADGTPLVLTGYNRRFSAYANALRSALDGRSGPIVINYRMNAGYIPADHWVHGKQGGGRNLGEACHVYDLLVSLLGSDIESVSVQAITPNSKHYRKDDNFIAALKTADGSVASLTYTALGSTAYPKETCEVYFDGTVAALEDYRSLSFHGADRAEVKTPSPDKGHLELLDAFAEGIRGGVWPISWEEQLVVARLALAVEEELRRSS